MVDYKTRMYSWHKVRRWQSNNIGIEKIDIFLWPAAINFGDALTFYLDNTGTMISFMDSNQKQSRDITTKNIVKQKYCKKIISLNAQEKEKEISDRFIVL